MKIILFGLFIMFASFSNLNAASLTVYLSKCRSSCDTETGKLKIYKGRKLLKKSKTLKTELKNLEAGTYYVHYNTVAERRRMLEVVIVENENKVLTLCFDDFEYNKKQVPSAIDVLSNLAKIQILCESKIDGVSISDSIFIFRNGENFFLNYHDDVLKLNEIQIEIIREFEYFLMYFSRKGRCKRTDKYTFFTGESTIKRKDKTCAWNGLYYLLVDLKLRDADVCD
jgi:hypothetical protein